MEPERIFRGSPHYYERVNGQTLGQNQLDFLSLNLPPACNLRCGFCFSGMNQRHEFSNGLTDDEYINIIRNAAGMGVRHLEISGEGEPFMFWPTMRNIISNANDEDAHVCIFTNGSLLNSEIIRELAHQDVSVAVSLESCDPDSHESFVQRSNVFERVVNNINELREAFRLRIQEANGYRVLPLAIHTIVMPQNIEEIGEIRRLAGNEIFLSLAPFIPQGDGIHMNDVAPQNITGEILERVQHEYGDGSLIVSDSSIETHGHPICGSFLYGLGIRYNGNVLFDAHAYGTSGYFGNVRDQSTDLNGLAEKISAARNRYFQEYDRSGSGCFCPLRNPRFPDFIRNLTA